MLSGLRPEITAPGCSFEEKRLAKLLEVKVAAQGRFSETRTFEGVRISNRGTTTDGGARMFVSTLRYDSTPRPRSKFYRLTYLLANGSESQPCREAN